LERERRSRMPKAARYPIFLLGLLTLIVGGFASQALGAPTSVDLVVGAAGFSLLLVSVGIR
jgi:hypothetical protein